MEGVEIKGVGSGWSRQTCQLHNIYNICSGASSSNTDGLALQQALCIMQNFIDLIQVFLRICVRVTLLLTYVLDTLAGADSPEIQQRRPLPPLSYSSSVRETCESTHGACHVAGRHCADTSASSPPPLPPATVHRLASRARRLCVATLPGQRSTCRHFVAGDDDSAQCRMTPCIDTMCRHNYCSVSLQ